jgi:hypothetical protein
MPKQPNPSNQQPTAICNGEIELLLQRSDGAALSQASTFVAILQSQLRKAGAKLWASSSGDAMILRVQNVTLETVDYVLGVIARFPAYGAGIAIRQRQVEITPLPGENGEELPSDTSLRERLTKRLLMVLPTGSRAVSNCCNGFNEVLGPRETREATWRRAIDCGANGRLFWLIPSNRPEAVQPFGGVL